MDVPEGVLTSEAHPLHGPFVAAHAVITLFRVVGERELPR